MTASMSSSKMCEIKEELNFLKRTKLEFEKAVQFINAEVRPIEKGLAKFLEHPFRQLTVRFPVFMDDGSIEMFTGYRVQHSRTYEPTKGGIRFSPDVDLELITALLEHMRLLVQWLLSYLGSRLSLVVFQLQQQKHMESLG